MSRSRVSRRTATTLGSIAGALILALISWALSSGDSGGSSSPSAQNSYSSGTSGSSGSSDPGGGLPAITVDQLPSQARTTLALIDRGGPFPYPRNDGVVFRNDDGRLPAERSGYYHEYTVPTPGSSDRGARRIITGSDHEFYWTADHYDSFDRIAR